jgi:CheY-like chemotaxis protein
MASPPAPKPVVLIVEDEPLLAFYARDVMEDAGYEVLVTANAGDAVIVLERRLDIRVLFTDVQLPGSMDGLRLAAIVRSRWPPIALVITSGRIAPAAVEMPAQSIFLSKPYAQEDLCRAVQSARDSRLAAN